MEFVNDTPFSAILARAQLIYRDLLMATVVMKCSFEVDREGPCISSRQAPVEEQDVETPFGTLETELVPVKPACDVLVFGNAWAYPPERPVESLLVSLRIGTFLRQLAVFGDRVWQRTAVGFRPSRPLPFTSMPLTYERAYGGSALQDETLVVHSHENPYGRGLVLVKERVPGTLLPNVEELDQLIDDWERRPMPAGMAPVPRHSILRGMRGMVVDLQRRTTRLEPAAFSCAHERMILPGYPAGSRLQLTGMRRSGPWNFTLPEIRAVARVSLGDANYALPLVPDTLYLLPEEDRFVVLARRALVYQFTPERQRLVRLSMEQGTLKPSAPGPRTVTSILEVRQSTAPAIPLVADVLGPELSIPLDDLLDQYPLKEMIERLPLCLSG